MRNENFQGERFSIKPERPDTAPAISDEGVVSGEIGHVETPETDDPNLERMRLIEIEARKDAQLADVFDAFADEDPSVRAANVLDRLNAIRRELDASDADAAYKRDRDLWLSRLANRLRELL